eukprot:6206757-Pleurochrysis_carterae.AAC.1
MGPGASDEPSRNSCGGPSVSDAQQHEEHLIEKVRALHDKWDKKYEDLPLADRRRLHERAQQR